MNAQAGSLHHNSRVLHEWKSRSFILQDDIVMQDDMILQDDMVSQDDTV